MSRLRDPGIWFSLLAMALAAALAIGCVLAGADGVGWRSGSIVIAALAALTGTGWFKAHAQEARARRAERALVSIREIEASTALRDPLTGLGNYRYLDTLLHAALLRAQRYGQPFAVLLIEAGIPPTPRMSAWIDTRDRILKYIASALSGCVREADAVARISDVTFAVVFTECDAECARGAWERVREAIVCDWPDTRSWSIWGGVAGYSVDVPSAEAMLAEADRRIALEKRRARAEPEA